MPRKVLVSFDLDSIDDKKVLLDLINRTIPSMEVGQQKLPHSDKKNVLGGDAFVSDVFVPATQPQRDLMDKMKIKWDENTSKDMASDLITKKFKQKKGGVEE